MLDWTLGPGLERSIVGLGPSGAWFAPCARVSVRPGPSSAPKEVLLVLGAPRVRNSEPPTERARRSGGCASAASAQRPAPLAGGELF